MKMNKEMYEMRTVRLICHFFIAMELNEALASEKRVLREPEEGEAVFWILLYNI